MSSLYHKLDYPATKSKLYFTLVLDSTNTRSRPEPAAYGSIPGASNCPLSMPQFPVAAREWGIVRDQSTVLALIVTNYQLTIARQPLPIVTGQSSAISHQYGRNNGQPLHCGKDV